MRSLLEEMRQRMENYENSCELCGAGVMPGEDCHYLDFRHRKHLVLTKRGKAGWLPVSGQSALTIAIAKQRRYTEYEGARDTHMGLVPIEFLRIDDAEDMIGTFGKNTVMPTILRMLVASTRLAVNHGMTWRWALAQALDQESLGLEFAESGRIPEWMLDRGF